MEQSNEVAARATPRRKERERAPRWGKCGRVGSPAADFDTLVADCEGALLPILKDTPEILAKIDLIIVENDYQSKAEHALVNDKLLFKLPVFLQKKASEVAPLAMCTWSFETHRQPNFWLEYDRKASQLLQKATPVFE